MMMMMMMRGKSILEQEERLWGREAERERYPTRDTIFLMIPVQVHQGIMRGQ
jgi:hypothetical protein